FRNEGLESRLEIQHVPLAGLRGVAGMEHSVTEARAAGVEAFLPLVNPRATRGILVEHLELDASLHVELGVRHEWLRHRPLNDPRARPAYRGTATSFSGAVVWEPVTDHYLTRSAGRAERLPHPQELYARGIHLATNT